VRVAPAAPLPEVKTVHRAAPCGWRGRPAERACAGAERERVAGEEGLCRSASRSGAAAPEPPLRRRCTAWTRDAAMKARLTALRSACCGHEPAGRGEHAVVASLQGTAIPSWSVDSVGIFLEEGSSSGADLISVYRKPFRLGSLMHAARR
jgi:hypothetical protein